MIIGIDGNESNVTNKVGTSVFTFAQIQYFYKQASKDLQFRVYLRAAPNSDMPKQNAYWQYRIVKGSRFWRDFFFPFYLFRKKEIDVLYSPSHYTPRFCPVPIVVAIHDVAYEYFPQEFLKKDLFKLRNWTKHAIDQASAIICVSESTRDDVIKFYDVSHKDVHVIYNGIDKPLVPKKSVWTRLSNTYSLTSHSYIFFLSTLQPRKNISLLIKAFAKIHDKFPDLKLVIAGKPGWLFEPILKLPEKVGIASKVVFTGYTSDDEKAALYDNATLFAFPSLYEGFGIILLEAMTYKVPVVSSYASSLREVGGDACEYFDPRSIDDCARSLKRVLTNKDIQKRLIKRGVIRASEFSWTTSAKETLNVIMNVANNENTTKK